jgi:hypothetical protein
MSDELDLLLISLGSTQGLRLADSRFIDMVRRAGASIAASAIGIGALDPLRRGYPINDIVEAIAGRRTLETAVARWQPRALVFSTTTAALLANTQKLPYTIWLDSPAKLNRPGVRNAVLHVLERRSFAGARLLLPLSEHTLDSVRSPLPPAVTIPVPIEHSHTPITQPRRPLVIAYTPDPKAKGLELVCRAWEAVAERGGARLQITGIDPRRARAFLAERGLGLPAGVDLSGMLAPEAFRTLLSHARVFLSGALWEDFGITQLEALDRGSALVTVAAGGPYPALHIARELEPRFVASERTPQSLAAALTAALRADGYGLLEYRRRALDALEPFREPVLVERLRSEVLPRLLG